MDNSRPLLLLSKLIGNHMYTSCDHRLKLSKLATIWSSILLIVVAYISCANITDLLRVIPKAYIMFIPLIVLMSFTPVLYIMCALTYYKHLRKALKAAYEFDLMTKTRDGKPMNRTLEWVGIIICVTIQAAKSYNVTSNTQYHRNVTDIVYGIHDALIKFNLFSDTVRFAFLINIFSRRLARLNELIINEQRNTSARPLTIFYVYTCLKCLQDGISEINYYFNTQMCILIVGGTGEAVFKMFLQYDSSTPAFFLIPEFVMLFMIHLLIIMAVIRPGHRIYHESKRLGRILFSARPPPVVDSTSTMDVCEFGMFLYVNPAAFKLSGLAIVNNALYTKMVEFSISMLIVLLPLVYIRDPTNKSQN